MEFSDTELIVIGLVVFGILIVFFRQTNKTESGLIKDEFVTTEDVYTQLGKIELKSVKGRKKGFTELDIEKQLEKALKEVFEHVTRQHGVGGTNAKKIDLDIGRGKVGVEIKIAREAVTEGGHDRLVGQVLKYKTRSYSNNNLIVLIAGLKSEERDTSLSDIKDFLAEHKISYIFKEVV